MTSPYGKNRGGAVYYQHGIENYVYNWTGVPFPSSRFGPASLGQIQLSRNERTWLGIAVAGVVGWFAWKKLT